MALSDILPTSNQFVEFWQDTFEDQNVWNILTIGCTALKFKAILGETMEFSQKAYDHMRETPSMEKEINSNTTETKNASGKNKREVSFSDN